jgi:hypothetical protein
MVVFDILGPAAYDHVPRPIERLTGVLIDAHVLGRDVIEAFGSIGQPKSVGLFHGLDGRTRAVLRGYRATLAPSREPSDRFAPREMKGFGWLSTVTSSAPYVLLPPVELVELIGGSYSDRNDTAFVPGLDPQAFYTQVAIVKGPEDPRYPVGFEESYEQAVERYLEDVASCLSGKLAMRANPNRP